MWFIGVEVEQETSAPSPKKILDLPLCFTDFVPYGDWIQLYFIIKNYYWCHNSSTLHKLDTSLRSTVGAGPNSVPLRENWLYELRNTQVTHTCNKCQQ